MATNILFKKESKKGLIVAYLEVGGLKIELIFNKNIIKLKIIRSILRRL